MYHVWFKRDSFQHAISVINQTQICNIHGAIKGFLLLLFASDKDSFTLINVNKSLDSLCFTQGQHITVWLLFLIILNESAKQISPFTLHPGVNIMS